MKGMLIISLREEGGYLLQYLPNGLYKFNVIVESEDVDNVHDIPQTIKDRNWFDTK